MKLPYFPFGIISWASVPVEEHQGQKGMAYWQVQMMDDIRVRKVEYSPGYEADHWCNKGHILFCTEGEMETELKDGRVMKLSKGMCYFVGDDSEPHRSSTLTGCKLFIVD